MKNMELEKIRNLGDAELKTQETQAGEQLFRLRFQKSLGNNEGTKRIRVLKHDIARIKTIARQRALGIDQSAAPKVKKAAPAASARTTRKKAKKD
jgi:large subunit ribosomal protein L29